MMLRRAQHEAAEREAGTVVTLTPKVAALLAIAAGHDRMSPEDFLAAMICRRVEEIGISAAVDWMEGSS